MTLEELKILVADLLINNKDLQKKVEEQALVIERLTAKAEEQKQGAPGESS